MKTPWKSRRPIALALAAVLLAGSLALPTPLRAQASEPTATATQKMQLQLQAIDAKREGDFAKAKQLLEQIIALDPNDPSNSDVQRQIDVINAALASQGAAKPAIVSAASSTPADAATVAATPAPADAAATPAAATPAAEAAPAPAPSPSAEAQASLAAEVARQNGQIADIRKSIEKAEAQEASGDFDGARATLDAALAQVPAGIKFTDLRNDIRQESAQTWYNQSAAALKAHDMAGAKDALAKYNDAAGGADSQSAALAKKITAAQNDPLSQSLSQVSPGFQESQDNIQQMLIKGRAQFLYGDFYGAEETFNKVKTFSPDNVEARAYSIEIERVLASSGHLNYEETRLKMLRQVDSDWYLPTYSSGTTGAGNVTAKVQPEMEKLGKIFIPSVNIDVPTPLDQVVQVLHDLSVRYDPDGKGINFHVYPPTSGEAMPKITLAGLNGLSLAQLLRVACSDAHPSYSFGAEDGVISLREGGSLSLSNGDFVQERIPLSESEMKELGINAPSAGGGDTSKSASPTDPFAAAGATPAPAATDTSAAPSTDDTGRQLQQKFIDNNIDFPAGSKVTMLGNSKISVVNTSQNIEKLKQFLRTLDDVKQVQITARFLDVSQNALKSFGTRWNVSNARLGNDFLRTGTTANDNTLRGLGNAFSSGATGAAPTVVTGLTTGTIASQPISGVDLLPGSVIVPQVIPTLPGAINTGGNASDVFSGVVSWLDGYRIQMVLDALDQEDGADLMSAPSLTVMDGTEANITVAQEFRYPEQFSGVTSTVSPASNNGGGGGGVAINAGTPSGFQNPYEIGVKMTVNPNVQPDDSIRMFIQPSVTQFEGFIEYGSASIAIQGTITAIVPSGVIQPIFDVRSLGTNVTVYDGATVVMGGLTRDEVDSVNDKVPVLGDIPLIGRMFQSKAQSSQKRNLMIFVTANLISPGGSPANQSFQNVDRGAIFTSPTLLSPAGPIQRKPPTPQATVAPTSSP